MVNRSGRHGGVVENGRKDTDPKMADQVEEYNMDRTELRFASDSASSQGH